MNARSNVKYTPAELQSFAIVPATCDAIDDAADKATRQFNEEWANSALRSNGIEPSPKMLNAMRELVMRQVWLAVHDVVNVAKYQGTFPLRLALVKEIEGREGGHVPPNNYQRWIRDRNAIAAIQNTKTGEKAE